MFALVFLAIYIFGSAYGLCFWYWHACAAIFALAQIHKFNKYYLFWFLLLIASLLVNQPRFSLEYFLLAAGFMAWGRSDWWLKLSEEKRKIYLGSAFILLLIALKLKAIFYEKGSLLLWLPVFLALYFPRINEKEKLLDKSNSKNSLVNFLIAPIMLYSNKKTTMLAYLASLHNYLKSKYFYLLGLVALIASFFMQDTIQHFYEKSLQSRIFIWLSSFNGFIDSPLWGHGFGTFAIDFPALRWHDTGIFGAKAQQAVAHGHSLFAHIAFEQGLVGIFLVVLLFYLVYTYARNAFLPLLVIGLFDSALYSFSQYLLAGLILLPYLDTKGHLEVFFKKINSKFNLPVNILSYVIAAIVFSSSLVGHYHYSQKNIDTAIQWDPYNSLYHFMKGADLINSDTKACEISLERAVELSPNIGYFYGFLAAAKLANLKFEEAKEPIAKALSYSGGDAYWYLLSSLINYKDKRIMIPHFTKALKMRPEIEDLLSSPYHTASEFIGSKKSDVRINSFYRRGPKVFLPLPVLDKLPNI